MTSIKSTTALLLLSCSLQPAACSLSLAADIVERKSNATPVTGAIANISKDEVTMTVGSLKKAVTIPSNDVANVRWDNEPAKLNLLRGDERAGRLQKALDGYAEVLKDLPAGEKNLRTDLTFLIARGTATLALSDPAKMKEAVSLLDDFIRSNSSNFRYYEAVELLGRLYVAQQNFDQANATYALLRHAPWPDYQMLAQIAEARVKLISGDIDGALAAFDQIATAEANEPAQQARRFEALIGKAVCLQKKGQHEQAAQALELVVRDVPADATAVQAEAYLRQGDSLLAAGKSKPALLAYLHVDLLFSKEESFHAEALYRLSQVWTTVGHPERAAETSARLQSRYPNSEWAKKSTGASQG